MLILLLLGFLQIPDSHANPCAGFFNRLFGQQDAGDEVQKIANLGKSFAKRSIGVVNEPRISFAELKDILEPFEINLSERQNFFEKLKTVKYEGDANTIAQDFIKFADQAFADIAALKVKGQGLSRYDLARISENLSLLNTVMDENEINVIAEEINRARKMGRSNPFPSEFPRISSYDYLSIRINHAKESSELVTEILNHQPDFLIVPIFKQLSWADWNRLLAYEVFPLQIMREPLNAGGMFQPPFLFSHRDLMHARSSTKRDFSITREGMHKRLEEKAELQKSVDALLAKNVDTPREKAILDLVMYFVTREKFSHQSKKEVARYLKENAKTIIRELHNRTQNPLDMWGPFSRLGGTPQDWEIEFGIYTWLKNLL